MKDIRQTDKYAKYLKKAGWAIEQKNGNYYFIKTIPLIGSIVKLQRPEKIIYKDILTISKKYRAFEIIIEPKDDTNSKGLEGKGFGISKSPFLPTKTLQIDLTASMSKIQASMKKDARLALDKTRAMDVHNVTSIEEFREAWKRVVGKKRHVPEIKNLMALKKSFGKNCLMLTTSSGNSGAIFLLGDKVAYYWQAFTNKAGRKELAQYKIVWEGIRWAKGRGARVFDFEGIYDARFPKKSWKGFTHFKKAFGGVEVEYPGTYTKLRLPL